MSALPTGRGAGDARAAEAAPQASPRTPAPSAAAVGFAAAALFGLSWLLLHLGFWGHGQIRDTSLYQAYGNLTLDGKVPYRDFKLEYPPGAIPAFALPAIGHGRTDFQFYEGEFEAFMGVCGAGCMLLVTAILRSLGASPRRQVLVLGFAGLAPLAVGSVILSRFDLWPTLLVLGALALLLRDRLRLGHAVLAAAFVTKLFPAVLLPLALAYAWRRRGRREAIACAAVFVAVSVVVVVPFVAVAPHDVLESVLTQTDRPLQLESLGAGILLALHQAFGLSISWYTSHGGQNIRGHGANTIAAVSTVIEAVVLICLWVSFARGPARSERLVRYAAAAVVAFVALGKVLSPQFMIWLIPLVPLVAGRRGIVAGALLGIALVLTQLWFPSRYWQLLFPLPGLAALPSWLVFARDLTLLALLATLSAPARAASRSQSPVRRLRT